MGLADAFHDAGEHGLRAAAEKVAEHTEENLPVGDPADDPDPAFALRDHVKVVADGDGFIVEVEGVYAAKQHEQQQLEHPRGGGPKFLERALTQAAAGEIEVIVASEVRARLARGLNRPL
jgi:hypothetical protein